VKNPLLFSVPDGKIKPNYILKDFIIALAFSYYFTVLWKNIDEVKELKSDILFVSVFRVNDRI